jgi:hypothetical protein
MAALIILCLLGACELLGLARRPSVVVAFYIGLTGNPVTARNQLSLPVTTY